MQGFTREEVKNLAQPTTGPAISLYFSTHEAGPDTRGNSIKMKNRIQDAERLLEERGVGDAERKRILKRAYDLVDDFDFWQHQRKGFAAFFSNDTERLYRLPLEVPELTTVSDRYHLKPLLPLLTGDGRFYVLVASMNQIRMLEGTRHTVSDVPLEDMPTSLSEFLQYDEFEQSLQHHTVWSQGRGAGGTGPDGGRGEATFHGHGAGGDADRKKVDLLRFFKQIDNGVRDMFAGENVPLVFAGVEYMHGIFKEANHYNALVPEAITGNFDHARDEEIHEQAWKVVQPIFAKAQEEDRERYGAGAGTGQTSTDLQELLNAAHDGRIDTVFVPVGTNLWGRYDHEQRTTERHDEESAGDVDLLDVLATQTILNGGTVYAVEPDQVPDGAEAAAIFRF